MHINIYERTRKKSSLFYNFFIYAKQSDYILKGKEFSIKILPEYLSWVVSAAITKYTNLENKADEPLKHLYYYKRYQIDVGFFNRIENERKVVLL